MTDNSEKDNLMDSNIAHQLKVAGTWSWEQIICYDSNAIFF